MGGEAKYRATTEGRRREEDGGGRGLTSCPPMHIFSVRKVQGGHSASLWQVWVTGGGGGGGGGNK